MFTQSETEAKLDAEISSLLDKLKETTKDSEEYATTVEHLSTLYKLKPEKKPMRVSPDTVLIVAANIFGILWVARYEKTDVIKSRNALGLVFKLPR